MDWKKWLFAAVIIIVVTNLVVVSAIPDSIIGLNVAIIAGMFSGVAFLAWWQGRDEPRDSDTS